MNTCYYSCFGYCQSLALTFRDETNATENHQSKKIHRFIMRSWANFHRCNLSASDGEFFYSTAIQIKDYIHFYGYRPVKSFAIRIPASYTIHGIDVSRWQERIDWQQVAKMRDNGIRLQFAFIKATEGEKLVDPYFRVTGN